jgi:putative nucleotidyltransferase with HDIG domain
MCKGPNVRSDRDHIQMLIATADHVLDMSFERSLEEQELLADNFRRAESSLSPRERPTEIALLVGLAIAIAALWAIRPPQSFSIVPALLSAAVLVVAMFVRIDTPFGFTVPTQLAFVPLLFAAPVALAPIVVVVAFVLGGLRDAVAGQVRFGRALLTSPVNAWFAVGPAYVFALADVTPQHAGAALLLCALAAQFLVDFTASALRFAITRSASFVSQLRETWVYVIDVALCGVGLQFSLDIQRRPAAVLGLLPLLALLAVFARERHHRLQNLLELGNAYRGTAMVLGDVVEADDGYTGEHSKSVVGLALGVGRQLGLGTERLRNLEFGALLHDIGKIAIPKEIINKPGKLEPGEWTVIKTHTVEGQKMLERVGGFMREVGMIVRSHHERWDGGGYPDGLAGEQIPLEARIIACCDSWNAMRTDRVYRPALGHDTAVVELLTNSGRQFDPRAVEALISIIAPQAEGPVSADDPPVLTASLG